MLPKTFHAQIDQHRLIAAIRDAESHTAGRIHVYVSHRQVEDPIAAANARFERMSLHKLHKERASVLIYIAPLTHKFAIVGDKAIHEACGDRYWSAIADKLSQDLKLTDPNNALLNAIATLKATMEQNFPAVK